MKSSTKRKEVIERLHGAKVEPAGVGDAIFSESTTIIECSEPKAHVRATSRRDSNIRAEAKQRSLEGNSGTMIVQRRFRLVGGGNCSGGRGVTVTRGSVRIGGKSIRYRKAHGEQQNNREFVAHVFPLEPKFASMSRHEQEGEPR